MKRLIIIDGNALVHRAYHALPKLLTKKGEIVNAVYGCLLAFFKVIKDFNPDFICACFDLPAPTFRHKEFKQYKAHRVKTSGEIIQQIPKVKQVLKVFSVSIFEQEGFEADDLIGTLALQAADIGRIGPIGPIEIIILTGDLDLLQLVNKNTKACMFKKGIKHTVLYDRSKVQERYGLSPALLPDYKALVGDASDNIPGVPGVGPKTAAMLLKEFGSLEGIYEHISPMGPIGPMGPVPAGQAQKLKDYKKQAFLSKMLATIRLDVPVNFDLQKCEWKDYNKEKAVEMLEKFGFKSLIKRLPGLPEKKTGKLF